MKLFFEPQDFLFFRDNRPFSAGEAFAGASRELPLPSVIYGAIRTFLLQQAGVNFDDYSKYTTVVEGAKNYPIISVTGIPTANGSLSVKGPYLAKRNPDGSLNEVFFTKPFDVIKYKKSKDNPDYGILEPDLQSQLKTNFPYGYLKPLRVRERDWIEDENDESENPARYEREQEDFEQLVVFKQTPTMKNYLQGLNPELKRSTYVLTSDIQIAESRIGIAIGDANVTQSGRFYSISGHRMHESYGLAFEIEGLDAQAEALFLGQFWFHLGGERRFGQAQILEATQNEIAPTAPSDLDKQFKLVLATPAVFKNGWLPGWLDVNGKGALPHTHIQVKLVSAVVGKPVIFSGYDMAMNQPKPIRKAVPAGSVYYFEVERNDQQEDLTLVHNQTISDDISDCRAGFGVAFVGRW